MFQNFGFDTASLFEQAEKERYQLHHPYVGSEHLLLAILKRNTPLSTKLKNMGLTYQKFKKELTSMVGNAKEAQELVLYTPLLKRIIELAYDDALEDNHGIVSEEHLLLALLEEGEGIAIRILLKLDIDLDELYDSVKIKNKKSEKKEKMEIYKVGNVLNETINKEEKVIGREQELEFMIETLLRKKKNNPLLIGKAGVGKSALVEELARRILLHQVPEELENKEIIMLEMGSLVAGTKYRGEFEERLNKIIKEIINDQNIILFIDEIHTMINAGGAEGAINASDILKPYLARGDIKVIGATTTEEYHKYIEKEKALERRFEKIQMEEPDETKTMEILKKVKKEYETHHHLKISTKAIEEIVKLGNKYIYNRQNPDKSLELLDSVCAHVKNKKESMDKISQEKRMRFITPKKERMVREGKYKEALELKKEENRLLQNKDNHQKKMASITKKDILEVLEQKTNIPIMQNKEKILKNLETYLKKNILGQENQIKKIIETLKIPENNRPTSFLLVGPSGIGKTETVKQIAKYYEKKASFIRLDMSEFTLDTSIHKLIGTPGGYVGYKEPFIFEKLKENPYSIILVDELEKSTPQIWNLFLQILDEGFITDATGEKIYFDKSMIFMTSNLTKKEKVGFSKKTNNDMDEILSKELMGRITSIITYEPITLSVVNQYLDAYELDEKTKETLINESEYEKYGLRNLKMATLKLQRKRKIATLTRL